MWMAFGASDSQITSAASRSRSRARRDARGQCARVAGRRKGLHSSPGFRLLLRARRIHLGIDRQLQMRLGRFQVTLLVQDHRQVVLKRRNLRRECHRLCGSQRIVILPQRNRPSPTYPGTKDSTHSRSVWPARALSRLALSVLASLKT
jgi:hypothetical protein